MAASAWTSVLASVAASAGLLAVACGEDSAGNTGGLAKGGSGGAGGRAGSGAVVIGGSGGGGNAGTSGAGSGGNGSGGAGASGGSELPPRPTAVALPSGWSPRTEFKPPSGSAALPDVVLESTGTAHVVADGSKLWIVTLDADGWGEPNPIHDTGGAQDFELAINDSDEAVLLWNAYDAKSSALSAHYTPEGGWISGNALGSSSAEVDEIDIAMSATGSALAVWVEGNDASALIRSSSFDGASWSAPVSVARSGFASLVRPAVGIDDEGRGAAMWRASAEGSIFDDYCEGAIFDGNVWSDAARISGELEGCYLPDLAMRGNGDALGVYEYEYDLYALRYTVAGGWETGVNMSNPVERGTYAGYPEIAFDGAGNALVVWREAPAKDAGSAPFTNRYDVSTGWTTAKAIESPPGVEMVPSAQLAVNSSGQGIAVWATTMSNGYRSLYASRYTPAAGFEPAFEVDAGLDNSGGASLEADINEAGDIVIVWDRRDDEGAHVFGTYFDAP